MDGHVVMNGRTLLWQSAVIINECLKSERYVRVCWMIRQPQREVSLRVEFVLSDIHTPLPSLPPDDAEARSCLYIWLHKHFVTVPNGIWDFVDWHERLKKKEFIWHINHPNAWDSSFICLLPHFFHLTAEAYLHGLHCPVFISVMDNCDCLECQLSLFGHVISNITWSSEVSGRRC